MVVAIAIGLPIATLTLVTVTQRRARRKLNRVNRWLYDHYGLAAPDRSRVKEAVLQGQRVSQPALSEAAYGLAGALLTGQVGSLNVKFIRMVAAADAALIVAILIAWLTTGDSGLAGSAVAGFAGLLISVSNLVHMRRRVAEAHQVNE